MSVWFERTGRRETIPPDYYRKDILLIGRSWASIEFKDGRMTNDGKGSLNWYFLTDWELVVMDDVLKELGL